MIRTKEVLVAIALGGAAALLTAAIGAGPGVWLAAGAIAAVASLATMSTETAERSRPIGGAVLVAAGSLLVLLASVVVASTFAFGCDPGFQRAPRCAWYDALDPKTRDLVWAFVAGAPFIALAAGVVGVRTRRPALFAVAWAACLLGLGALLTAG